jgi:hypothetical protein
MKSIPGFLSLFYAEGYQERQDKGEEQKQLSKEFVRRWLIENGFRKRRTGNSRNDDCIY